MQIEPIDFSACGSKSWVAGGSEPLFRFPCNKYRTARGIGMKLATHIDAGLGKNPIEYGGYMSKTEGGITMGGGGGAGFDFEFLALSNEIVELNLLYLACVMY